MSLSPVIQEADLLNLLVRSVKDHAIYALDIEGHIVTWNEGAKNLKGYSPEEIKGQHFSIFYSTDDRAAQRPEQALAVAKDTGSFEGEGWRYRKDGTRFWAKATISSLFNEQGQLIGFAKITQDITKNRESAERERLIKDIAIESATASRFEALLQTVVSRLGDYLGWPLGHAYIWHETEQVLKSAHTWYIADEQSSGIYQKFQELSEQMTFASGVGLPGRILSSQAVVWIQDISNDSNFPRGVVLEGFEFVSAIGIPLIENGKVIATLEFFSKTPIEEIESIIELGRIVSIQFSRFIERQRAAEEQEFFFNSSIDMLSTGGFDGFFRRVNPSWTKVLGYTEEEMLSHPWIFFVHPDDIDRTISAGSSLVNESETVILENRYRCKDGSYRWLQWHSVPISGRDTIYGIARDVTEQKAKDRLLEETLSLQRAILDSTSYGIISVDLTGLVQTFNAGAERIFGYSAEEFVRVPTPPRLTDPAAWPDQAKLLSEKLGMEVSLGFELFIQLAEQTHQEEFEWTFKRKDGTSFPALLAVTALKDENQVMTGYTCIIQDMTIRRQAEASRNRLLKIVDHSPDFIAYGNIEEGIVFINRGGERMLGVEEGEMLGRNRGDFMPKWVQEKIATEAYPQVAIQGYWQGETAVIHADGHEIPVSQAFISLPSEPGEPDYVAVIIRDITEFKRAEARLAEQARDLRHSNQELEQFAYVASHDLQEPLRMVCSFLGLLELEYNDKLNDEAREYIRYAVDGGMRMRKLIDGLLDFSRVGRQTIQMKPIDMELVLQDALKNLEVAIRDSEAEITSDPLPTVLGDKTNLTRLMQNLIGNSLKFRSDEPVKVHVSIERQDDGFLFSVQDNGIGIAPKHEEKIFMIFQRLHSKEKYPGSGIGLSICRKIVERHDGRLWLDTSATNGARFLFTLQGEK